MTKDEALRLALDALTTLNAADDDRDFLCLAETDMLYAAIEAIRAALSAPAAQPVPVVQREPFVTVDMVQAALRSLREDHRVVPCERAMVNALGAALGAAPSVAGPVVQPLTDEQKIAEFSRPCYQSEDLYEWFDAGVRFAERAHGIGGRQWLTSP